MGVLVEDFLDRGVATKRNVRRESIERGLGGEPDELGALDGDVASDGFDDGPQGRGAMVFDVGGHLGEVGGCQP